MNANTGEIKWKLKLGIEQRNSCPLYADGKLYVPMLDNPGGKGTGDSAEAGSKGAFYIIKPGDQPEILQHAELDGRCFGTPVAYNGKLYMQTTKYLYCWGKKGNNPGLPTATAAGEAWPHSRSGQVTADHSFRSHACVPARAPPSGPARLMRTASSSKRSRI